MSKVSFTIRLLAAFVIAPFLGVLIGSIIPALFFTPDDGGSAYSILFIAGIIFGYPNMVLGIFFVGLLATYNLGIIFYVICGLLVSSLQALPLVLLMDGSPAQLFYLVACYTDGIAIAVISYLVMQPPKQAVKSED